MKKTKIQLHTEIHTRYTLSMSIVANCSGVCWRKLDTHSIRTSYLVRLREHKEEILQQKKEWEDLKMSINYMKWRNKTVVEEKCIFSPFSRYTLHTYCIYLHLSISLYLSLYVRVCLRACVCVYSNSYVKLLFCDLVGTCYINNLILGIWNCKCSYSYKEYDYLSICCKERQD